ncbi:pyridoxamine 5'-phosphate oxidase family protein [Amycolatopsis sp. Hca4]|uniref:pyridoxamine 5'-phosphate oxidase family protein n=1 Tax=Amycolatopsis sp. Hca4 TaxID=2742131 RepID=UPI0020CB25DD|nr:pyridoxamine 5'-phosphate oxidase family protein [Amycolatopsis sp. Hca4]
MTTLEQAAVADLVRNTLSAHKSLFLATSGRSGPWVGGVYFAESGEFTLNLVLEDRGRTLAAIRENPVVSVVVSTGSPMQPFLQAQASAEILGGPRTRGCANCSSRRSPRPRLSWPRRSRPSG